MKSENLIVYQYTLSFHNRPSYNPDVYMVCFVGLRSPIGGGSVLPYQFSVTRLMLL